MHNLVTHIATIIIEMNHQYCTCKNKKPKSVQLSQLTETENEELFNCFDTEVYSIEVVMLHHNIMWAPLSNIAFGTDESMSSMMYIWLKTAIPQSEPFHLANCKTQSNQAYAIKIEA